ncbi:MAG: hypothetical protein WKF75_11180 [Singulisphaera sp.]
MVHTSPGLSWVFQRRLPVAASAPRPRRSPPWRAGSSGVGRLGAVFTSVPKYRVLVSGSYEGVDQTLLVAGPNSNACLPQGSSTTTGGSSFWGLGPTSYFQAILPVAGSSRHEEAPAGAPP